MAAGPENDILTKPTEALEQLTINNAFLTTKLSNTTKLNLEMAKTLNLKATQVQYPEDKRLKEIARKNVAFERNLYPDIQCWTHRFRVTKQHSIQTFSSPAEDHQRTASRKIS